MTRRLLVNRRQLLIGAGAVTGAALVPGLSSATTTAAASRRLEYPFTLGVSSGDPLPDSVVLWTRLAPEPLEPDGGMPRRNVPVRWQVSESESFRKPVRQGVALARTEDGHAVHVDVKGLRPHRWYWYRFIVGSEASPVGRTRTAPALGTAPAVAFAFVSCSQYEHGYFTAYRHLAEENPDVVFHLGDYIYEYAPGGYVAPGGNVRDHVGDEIRTIGDYRRRYAQYRTDPDLQEAHAAAPWIVTWDDHEVDNNYADDVPENQDPGQGNDTTENFLARRSAAYKAYWENMPIRQDRRATGPDMPLYRGFTYGNTASFSVLDTRQYRTDQPCGDEFPAGCGEEFDPDATILGDAQAGWLEDRLARSESVWNVVPQQIFFANLDAEEGGPTADDPRDGGYPDGWDGYRASRHRLLDFITEREVENFVVLTGDIHSHYLADLRRDFEDETSPVLGTELVCSSISSGGDGSDRSSFWPLLQPENPHLRYNNNRRGYVSCRLDSQTYSADFRVVDRVSEPDAQLRTDASYVIEAGDPRAQEA
ncbi:alkaline phosphatase D family protein [Phytoactinopolyspora endophytica]|uniref:alkaline phosphatase D family protein n=1 Tax=Phytoactinopolyspora endophytica TaxID=1642495 RepID=UPI00101D177D|nr:alkaline phosphatase D family protein [Phytoactinopolyspora endophytica]